jgi:hypothetical protein
MDINIYISEHMFKMYNINISYVLFLALARQGINKTKTAT